MKINRPLINPTPRDIVEEQEKKNQQMIEQQLLQQEENIFAPVSREQLRLPKESRSIAFKQFINSLKIKVRRKEDFLELSQLWKQPAVPFAIVTFLFNIGLFLLVIIFKLGSIPPRVPFFYNSVTGKWVQVDKSMIIFFPIFIAIISVIITRSIISIFSTDRRLALTISWIVGFVNTMLLITMTQIYYLVT